MIRKELRVSYFVISILLVGCSSLAPFLSPPTAVPAQTATSTPQPTPTSTAPAIDQPRLLRVWLPPQFDPNTGTPSAELLKQRLQNFESTHSGIQIEVRIKDDADILNALSVTANAAPGAMPDLIALSHSNMQTAASAGYLHPLEGLTTILQDPDWYVVAREFGHVQNTEFGLPFACDALLAVYRPAVFESMPAGWNDVFSSGSYIAFPVADPEAFFSLALYLSDGSRFVDDQGVATLNEETLIKVLSFYKSSLDTETTPPAIRDYQTDAQVLQYYRDGKADLAIVWASSDIDTKSGQYMPVPGLNDVPYSFADGWVWALAGPNVENQPLAVELAAHLVESGFMSEWTSASGYLPTRPQALAGWGDEELRESVNGVLQSAHPLPSGEVLSVVSPLLREALRRVMNGEQVEVVARSVMEQVK